MCDCRNAVNKRLAFSNSKIAEGLMFGNATIEVSPPMIVLEKIDKTKRGKPPTLLASCCPFCGKRYEKDTAAGAQIYGSRSES